MSLGPVGKGGYVAPSNLQEPQIPARTQAKPGADYQVGKGDTLWKLAQEAYGDPTKWTLIRDANKDQVRMRGDVPLIQIGANLKIPPAPQGWGANRPDNATAAAALAEQPPASEPAGNGLRLPTGPSGEGLRLPPGAVLGGKPTLPDDPLLLPEGGRIGGKPTLPDDPLLLPGGGRIGGKPTLPDDPLLLPGGGRIGGKPQEPPATNAGHAFARLAPELERVQSWLENTPHNLRQQLIDGRPLSGPFADTGKLIADTRKALADQFEALPPDQREKFVKLLEGEFAKRPFARAALLGEQQPVAAPTVIQSLDGPSFADLAAAPPPSILSPVHADPSIDLGEAATAMNGTAMSQHASTAATSGRALAVIDGLMTDKKLEVNEYGTAMRALAADLKRAGSLDERAAMANAVGAKLEQLLATVPAEQQPVLAIAMEGFQKLSDGLEGDAAVRELDAFGSRLEQLKGRSPGAAGKVPHLYGEVVRALSDKEVAPSEFGKVLRAVIADVRADPSARTMHETAAALNLLGSHVKTQNFLEDAEFRRTFSVLAQVVTMTPPSMLNDLDAIAKRFDQMR